MGEVDDEGIIEGEGTEVKGGGRVRHAALRLRPVFAGTPV
jgi:hypothetical protein